MNDDYDEDTLVSAAWFAHELGLDPGMQAELERRCGAVARLGDYAEALELMEAERGEQEGEQ